MLKSWITALALVFGIVSAGCGASKPSLEVIAIATQEPPPPGEVACMTALLEGTLVRDARTGLGVASQDGAITPVRWPNDWQAFASSPVALVDADGKAVARVGDHISLGGGFGNDHTFYACPVGIATG